MQARGSEKKWHPTTSLMLQCTEEPTRRDLSTAQCRGTRKLQQGLPVISSQEHQAIYHSSVIGLFFHNVLETRWCLTNLSEKFLCLLSFAYIYICPVLLSENNQNRHFIWGITHFLACGGMSGFHLSLCKQHRKPV